LRERAAGHLLQRHQFSRRRLSGKSCRGTHFRADKFQPLFVEVHHMVLALKAWRTQSPPQANRSGADDEHILAGDRVPAIHSA
jgi:hypothetical protein